MMKTALGLTRQEHPLASAACALVLMFCGTGAQAQPAPGSAGTELDTRLAQAQADPKLADPLLKTGRKVAAFCANCHGDNGNSAKPEVPNLAGQNTAYLLEQLRQFGDGRRRNEFMQSMIKAMSSDEKLGAALFYASQPVTPRPTTRPDLLAQGGDIYQKNCFRCHGTQGMGNEKIARIAGQQPEYLMLSIRRYRSGSGVRTDPLMASNTRLLSDAQVDAVAAYVSALR
jgi:cytochrome c553